MPQTPVCQVDAATVLGNGGFFSGMQPSLPQPKGQDPHPNSLEITISDTNKVVKAKFLTWRSTRRARFKYSAAECRQIG